MMYLLRYKDVVSSSQADNIYNMCHVAVLCVVYLSGTPLLVVVGGVIPTQNWETVCEIL